MFGEVVGREKGGRWEGKEKGKERKGNGEERRGKEKEKERLIYPSTTDLTISLSLKDIPSHHYTY